MTLPRKYNSGVLFFAFLAAGLFMSFTDVSGNDCPAICSRTQSGSSLHFTGMFYDLVPAKHCAGHHRSGHKLFPGKLRMVVEEEDWTSKTIPFVGTSPLARPRFQSDARFGSFPQAQDAAQGYRLSFSGLPPPAA